MTHVTIYTDGGCKPNPGPGGWGAVLVYDDHVREIKGGADNTTNNRMELEAAWNALNTLKWPCDVTLITDSQYLKRGITEWLPMWKMNGWKSSNRKPVKNKDLWMALDHKSNVVHNVTWQWTRGHTGNKYNERADQLATEARERIENQIEWLERQKATVSDDEV